MTLARITIESPEPKWLIERATRESLPCLVAMVVELGISEGSQLHIVSVESGLRTLLEDPHCWALIARDPEGQVVGMALLTSEPSTFSGGRQAWLSDALVRKEFEGRGVFRALQEHFIVLAARAGIKKIRLLVNESKVEVQSKYRHLGWSHPVYRVMEFAVTEQDTRPDSHSSSREEDVMSSSLIARANLTRSSWRLLSCSWLFRRSRERCNPATKSGGSSHPNGGDERHRFYSEEAALEAKREKILRDLCGD